MNNRAGLDISINGTGIAVSNGNFYFQTSLKRLPKKINHPNIFADTALGSSKQNHKRYYQNNSNILKFLLDNNVNKVGIENYAYGYGGSSPGLVFDISENTGFLKCLLTQNDIEIITFPPKQIKKFFTGNGNASKIIMVEKYFEKIKNSPIMYLIDEFNISRYDNPIHDLVDAYAILQMII